MSNKKFENKYSLKSSQAISLIEQLFEQELPFFTKTKVYVESIYFGVSYRWRSFEIYFGGDRGGFDHKILIKNQDYSLRHFDKIMDYVVAASEKNIRFAFEVLKEFLQTKIDDLDFERG